MNITRKEEGSTLTILPEGHINVQTAPELEKSVENLDGVQQLIFDLSSVDMVASAGFRVLIAAHKKMKTNGGSMKVIHVNDEIMKVCRFTGFADVMDIS